MKLHHILILTSLCMPFAHLWIAHYYQTYNLYLMSITFLGGFISVGFWIDPVQNRNQWIHKLDAISARFVIVNYTLYKIFINRNNMLLYFWHFLPMLYYFYLSNKISTQHWCSNAHIKNHITAHLYCILCCYIAVFQTPFLRGMGDCVLA